MMANTTQPATARKREGGMTHSPYPSSTPRLSRAQLTPHMLERSSLIKSCYEYFGKIPLFVKDVLSHLGTQKTVAQCSARVTWLRDAEHGLRDAEHVAWIFIPEHQDQFEKYPARILAWDLKSQNLLFDLQLPVVTNVHLIVPYLAATGLLAVLICTSTNRIYSWANASVQASCTTLQLTLDNAEDKLLCVTHVNAVGPVVVSNCGQMFIVTAIPKLTATRVWRNSDSILGGIGRQVSSLFGYLSLTRSEAAIQIVAAGATSGGLWTLTMSGVQFWEHEGSSLVKRRDISILTESGEFLGEENEADVRSVKSLVAVLPTHLGIFVLARLQFGSGVGYKIVCIDDKDTRKTLSLDESKKKYFSHSTDAAGVQPTLHASDSAVFVVSRCLIVRLGFSDLEGIADWDTESMERVIQAHQIEGNDVIGCGAVGGLLVVVHGSRGGGIMQLRALDSPVAPDPGLAVFLPSTNNPAVDTLNALFVRYCTQHSEPQANDIDNIDITADVIAKLSALVAAASLKVDERWAEGPEEDAQDSPTVGGFIKRQLDEKKTRHKTLMDFLRFPAEDPLWHKGVMSVHDDMQRIAVLCKLRELHMDKYGIVVKKALANIPDNIPDSAYEQVSDLGLGKIFTALSKLPQDSVEECSATAEVMQSMLVAAYECHEALEKSYGPIEEKGHRSWLEMNPVRRAVYEQYSGIVRLSEQGHPIPPELLEKVYYFAIQWLTALYKDFQTQDELGSKFMPSCKKVISFFEKNNVKISFNVADSFACLDELARLCDTYFPEKVDECTAKNADFRAAHFQFLLDGQQHNKILHYDMEKHLDPFVDLAWINQLKMGEHCKASQSLTKMADAEVKSSAAKRTLLSLALMCATAADHTQAYPVLQTGLELLEYQTQALELSRFTPAASAPLSGAVTAAAIQRRMQAMDAPVTALDDADVPPLQVNDIAAIFADHGTESAHFCLALEVCRFDRLSSGRDFQEIIVRVFSKAIAFNQELWHNNPDAEGFAKETVLFDAILGLENKNPDVLSKINIHSVVERVAQLADFSVMPKAIRTVWQIAVDEARSVRERL